MRAILIGLAFVLMTTAAHAGQGLTGDTLHLAQNNNTIIESDSARPMRQPGVRPQRFYCVIDPPDSAQTDMKYSCPASPGRVGGRCRCSGVVGTGTLYTY